MGRKILSGLKKRLAALGNDIAGSCLYYYILLCAYVRNTARIS